MLDKLVDLNSRELQLKKSKIYKQILDNQIIQNKQYEKYKSIPTIETGNKINSEHLKRQFIKPITHTNRPSLMNHSRNTSGGGSGKRNILNRDNFGVINLNKQGTSRFIKVRDQALSNTDKYQNPSIRYSDDEESIDQILIQVKQLVQKCQNLKRSKKQRLIESRIKDKQPLHLPQLNKDNQRRYRAHESPLNYKLFQFSQSPTASKSNLKLQYNTATTQKHIQFIDPQTIYKDIYLDRKYQKSQSKDNQNTIVKHNLEKLRCKTQLNNQINEQDRERSRQQRREDFINILKKVKNRGESLFMKVSKAPA